MLILQDLRKIHCSEAQYYFFGFCLVDNIIQKQIDIILTSGIPVKPIIVLFNSILHLEKILLYVFLIYVQCFILQIVYDVFFYFFHHQHNSMIAFCQYPIIKRRQDISRRLLTPNSDTLSLPFGFILHFCTSPSESSGCDASRRELSFPPTASLRRIDC